MLKFMLDTNICIFTIKNKPASVRERFNLNQGRMCISSVTLMELIYGAEKSQMTTTCDFIFALLFTLTPQNPGDNKEGDQADN